MNDPVCELEEFFFTKIHVAWHEPAKAGSAEVDYLFDYEIGRHADEKNRYRLVFRVGAHPRSSIPAGYVMDSEVVGFFRFPPDMVREMMERLIRINGCTILYGILRGHLATVSGTFPGRKLLLPTVMMEEVVQEIERLKSPPAKAATTRKKAATGKG